MYQLLCKDEVRATFDLEWDGLSDYDVVDVEVTGILPYGVTKETLDTFLYGRFAAKHKKHIRDILIDNNADNTKGYFDLTHGVSVNDTYWVKEDTTNLNWNDVSPYAVSYIDMLKTTSLIPLSGYQGLFSVTPIDTTTNGNFNKCWTLEDDGLWLYKGGDENRNGVEPYNEVCASEVFAKLNAGIKYELVNYNGMVTSRCKLFTTDAISFVPMSVFNPDIKRIAHVLNYFRSVNCDNWYRRMMIADAITINTDRHLGNFGVLVDTMTNQLLSYAPAFDYNLAMMPYATIDDLVSPEKYLKDLTARSGDDFFKLSQLLMTDDIHDNLVHMKGIELTLPWYTDEFPERRAKRMTDIVNARIDAIVDNKIVVYPPMSRDGMSNLEKYRLAKCKHLNQWGWEHEEIPRLKKIFGTEDMSVIEERIVDLL